MNFTQLMTYAPIAVGCLVGLGVAVFFTTRKRRSSGFAGLKRKKHGDTWDEHEESFADRRNSVRRDGPPVKVIVTSSTLRGGQDEGFVLDRSTGGLRVAVMAAIPAMTNLQVRAENAPDTVPWVSVIVRSCRHTGEHYELGCEFDKTPPWNVLLLFG
jgi:PilZ domain